MPDFSGQALGFYLQIADQATPGLDKATKSYLALAKAMESTSKTATTSSGKSAQGMALLAGAMEAVDENTQSSVGSINDFVKAYKTVQKIKPAKAAALAGGVGGGGGGAGGGGTRDVRMKAVYPTGQRDAHFDRSSLLGAYKQMTLPPDYVMKMPFMAEGGVVTSPTVAMVGESGPEAIIPLDKIEPMLQDLVTKSAAWGAVGIKKKARDNLEQYIGEVRDGSMVMEKRWEALYKIQDTLNAQYFTIRKSAQNMGQSHRLLSDQLGITTNSTKLYQVAIEKASEENEDFNSSGVSIVQTLSNVKGAIMDALTASGAWTAALGAAAFALAMSMESDLFTVRQQMTMTNAEFENFKRVGMNAMSDFGLTVEETVGIMKTAAFNKLTGKEMEAFVKNVALGTQALEGMGATSESVADLVWNGFNRLNITGRAATRTLSGMAAAAKLGNIEFEQLAGYVKDNADLFLQIKYKGGDASKAMIEMSAVAAEYSNKWLDAGEAMQFVSDVTDMDKWTDLHGIMKAIGDATGISNHELKAMAEAGEVAQLLGARAMVAWQIDEGMLRHTPERVKELYGMAAKEAMGLKLAYTSAAKAREGVMASAKEAAAGAKDAKVLRESWAAFNKTLGLMITRIKNIVLPVLYQLGEPMLEIVSYALIPLVKGMRFLMDIFTGLPKPLKLVVSGLLGLKLVSVALAVVQSVFAIPSLSAFTAAVWANISSLKGMALSTWANIVALKAFIITTWAKVLSLKASILTTWESVLAQKAMTVGTWASIIARKVFIVVTWASTLALNVMAIATGAASSAFIGMATAVWAALAPIIPFVLIGVAIVAVLYGLYKIVDALLEPLGGFAGVWEILQTAFVNFTNTFWSVLAPVFEALKAVGGELFNTFGSVVGWLAGKVFGPLIEIFNGFLKMLDGDFLGGLADIAWGMVKVFTTPLRMLKELVWGAVSGLGGLLYGAGSGIYDAITWPFRKAWAFISELFSAQGLLGGVKDVFLAMLKGLLNMTLVSSVNGMIAVLNAALDYVPLLGNNTISYRMAAFAEGGIVTEPTIGLLGEAGKEAIIPLNDTRAVGEFAAATNLAVQDKQGAAAPQITLQQKKTEDLLTQIRDVLIIMSGEQKAPARARAGRGLVEDKSTSWEM